METRPGGEPAPASPPDRADSDAPGRLPPRVRRIPEWVPHPEWILVTLSVMAAALSAFSVWQATTFAEDAADTQNQERIAADRRSEELAAFSVKADHDLRLAVRYCASLTERGWALIESLDDVGSAEGAVALASATRRATLLGSLFQVASLADCQAATGDELIPLAYEWEVSSAGGLGGADPERLAIQARELGERETGLMQAGVAFAAALLLLTLADAAATRRRRRPGAVRRRWLWPVVWAGGAVGLLAVGFTWALPRIDIGGAELAWMAAVVAAGALVSLPLTVRLGARARGAAGRLPLFQGEHRWWTARSVGWWAEIVGAATLVAFAATALGFSVASLRERNSEASADRIAIDADRVLRQREQSAMRDLAFVAGLVELNAGDPELAEAVRGQIDAIEEQARADLRDLVQPSADGSCSIPPDDTASVAADLLVLAESDRTAFSDHIVRRLEPGVACAALSAAVREQAASWGDQRATFTIGLVVLGLAGFLIASAGDQDRSRRTAGWLFRVGVVGALLGLAVTALATSRFFDPSLAESGGGDDPGVRAFARAYAAGRTALEIGQCEPARLDFTRALDHYDRFAAAYVDRADALACPTEARATLTSAMDEAATTAYLADLEEARRRGLTDTRVLGGLGWGYFLRWAHDGAASDLSLARELTTQALAQVETLHEPNGRAIPIAHVLRLNLALIDEATGRESGEAYARAFDCLSGDETCPGGAIADRFLRDIYLLSALADLELLSTDEGAHDRARMALLSRYLGMEATDTFPDLPGFELDLFPMEVQLEMTTEGEVPPLSIIWYHRGAEHDPWAVVLNPSLITYLPGEHLDKPFDAGSALPGGEYRADIYVDGRLVTREYTREPEPSTAVRRSVPDLGLALALPSDWDRLDEFSEYGEEAWFGPHEDDPRILLWRSEGEEVPDEARIEEVLDQWVRERFPDGDPTAGAYNLADPYYLRLSMPVWREYPEIGWRASAGFSSYGSSESCPGTLLMALYQPDERGIEIHDSIVVTQSLATLPELPRAYESAAYGFAVQIPDGWDAYELPPELRETQSQFVATDCASGTNLRVGSEPVGEMSLTEYVDLTHDALAADLEGFELIARTPFTLPSGIPAEELLFTWDADPEVVQSQVYAISESVGYFMTFTATLEEIELFEDEYILIAETFDVVPRSGDAASEVTGDQGDGG